MEVGVAFRWYWLPRRVVAGLVSLLLGYIQNFRLKERHKYVSDNDVDGEWTVLMSGIWDVWKDAAELERLSFGFGDSWRHGADKC